MAQAFCVECGKHREYIVKRSKIIDKVRDVPIEYTELTAICAVCGSELYSPAINDANVDARLNAYYAAKGELKCSSVIHAMSPEDVMSR